MLSGHLKHPKGATLDNATCQIQNSDVSGPEELGRGGKKYRRLMGMVITENDICDDGNRRLLDYEIA